MVEIINEENFNQIIPLIEKNLKLLNGLIKYLENSKLK
jgi:c-di-GMP-related signal transduction protein